MNFEEIPAIFWMIVISCLSALFGMVLYYLAMSLKESNNTMKEVTITVQKTNKILDETDEILKETREVIEQTKMVVEEVNQTIVVPARSVGSVLTGIAGFFQGLKGE